MRHSQTDEVISEGDDAPDFRLFTHTAESWQLSEHLRRPVVLLFFPGAFTSVCTTELNTVNNDLESFGSAHLVGISTDSPAVLSEFHSANDLEFPLLSDHDAEVSQKYGVKYDSFTSMNLDRIAKRAAFVVDTKGTIRYAEVLENVENQPDFDAVKQVLGGLGHGD